MELTQLVFSGGGVRAVAYAGALEVLATRVPLSEIRRVAGTSAGALAATLVALGGVPSDITALLLHAPYADFADGGWGALGDAGRLLRGYGLHPGDALATFVRDAIDSTTQTSLGTARPDLTLGELSVLARAPSSRLSELFVISTNLTRQSAMILSAQTASDLPIWKAVRMSMSIPGFFAPVSWEGDLWVDGGVSWNYPIDLFEPTGHRVPGMPVPGGETLGMCLGTRAAMAEGARREAKIENLEGFFQALVSFALQESTRMHLSEPDLGRTVFVPDEGVGTLELDVSLEELEALVRGGRDAMQRWLDAPV